LHLNLNYADLDIHLNPNLAIDLREQNKVPKIILAFIVDAISFVLFFQASKPS